MKIKVSGVPYEVDMPDLRKAAEMALEAWDNWAPAEPIDLENKIEALRQALRQALAQPEQEPVAWMVYSVDGQSVCITDDPTSFSDDQRALPLWPGPFEREWVGLTDDEKGWCAAPTYEETVNRTEAKLKEKNT